MTRTNVTTWSDCEVLTRLSHSLVEEMMKYQKYSLGEDKSIMGGDRMVMVSAITLRDRLIKLIDRSPH